MKPSRGFERGQRPESGRSLFRDVATGLLVAVISGVIVAWLIQDARFSSERGSKATPSAALSPTSRLSSPTTREVEPTLQVESERWLSPTPISAGTSYNGTLAAGEADVYSLLDPDSAFVGITVYSLNHFDYRLEVRHTDGTLIVAQDNTMSWFSRIELSFAPEPGVEYIIIVRNLESTEGSGGSYVISMN